MIAIGCCDTALDSFDIVGQVQIIILAYPPRKTSNRERKRVLEGIWAAWQEKASKQMYQIQASVADEVLSVWGRAMVMLQVHISF